MIDVEYQYVSDGWSISSANVGPAAVNLGELPPGNYTVNARLYDNANPDAAPTVVTTNIPVLAPEKIAIKLNHKKRERLGSLASERAVSLIAIHAHGSRTCSAATR